MADSPQPPVDKKHFRFYTTPRRADRGRPKLCAIKIKITVIDIQSQYFLEWQYKSNQHPSTVIYNNNIK